MSTPIHVWRHRISEQIAAQVELKVQINRDRMAPLVQTFWRDGPASMVEFVREYGYVKGLLDECDQRILKLRALDEAYQREQCKNSAAVDKRSVEPAADFVQEPFVPLERLVRVERKPRVRGNSTTPATVYSPPWLLSWLPHGGMKPFSEMEIIPQYSLAMWKNWNRKQRRLLEAEL